MRGAHPQLFLSLDDDDYSKRRMGSGFDENRGLIHETKLEVFEYQKKLRIMSMFMFCVAEG